MVKRLVKIVILVLSVCYVNFTQAQKKPITLVSSNALTGPAAGLGSKLTQGANVYFNKINSQGGIAGRPIQLKTLDDGYEPFRTVANTYDALKTGDFLAFFNYAGTPNSVLMMPIITKHKIPYLTPFTGAEFLRTPIQPYIFNLRSSYNQEAKAQIDYLLTKVKAKKIALLVQADEFGATVEHGYVMAMQQHGIKPVVTTRYRRNTHDIDLVLDIMMDHKVDAIAFVGTYKPLIQLIKQAYQQNFTPFFTTVSFISSDNLFAGIKVPAKVLVTEVVPAPSQCTLIVCQEFLQDIKQYKDILPEQVVFEGYLNAKLFVEVAKLCELSLTRACLLKEFSHFESDFGGLKVKFTPTNHQGLSDIYFSLFENKI